MRELHTIDEPMWQAAECRFLIARLSPWQDVRFSFTHRILHSIIAQVPGVVPDMGYMPAPHEVLATQQQKTSWLYGRATQKAALEFNVIGISQALVQETINLAPLLQNSGIPVGKKERMARPDVPLILLGGANSLYSSALLGDDPLVDGIFVGEEPEMIARIASLCRDNVQKDKQELLRQLCTLIPGFFVPDAPKAIEKHHGSVPQINLYKPWEPPVHSPEEAGSAAVQLAEGCPYFCSFCAESFSRKPYRENSAQSVLETALEMKASLGLEHIDLFAFNFNTHASIHSLVGDLLEVFGSVGLKSQRFDALADDPAIVEVMRLAGKSSVTCGLEGISERMRSYLQKQLDKDHLERALQRLMLAPLREMKIFLIATGLETEEDLAEFAEFLAWFADLHRRSPRKPRIMFSATPLVRFPWTPLEFENGPARIAIFKGIKQIKNQVVKAGFDFREAAEDDEYWVSQVLVRAKDARILQALMEAQTETGFIYSDGISSVFREAFQVALARILELFPNPTVWSSDLESSLDPLLLGHAHDADVPWAMWNPGVSRAFLIREHRKCVEAKQMLICLGTYEASGKCKACDACTPEEQKAITQRREIPDWDSKQKEARLRAIKASEMVSVFRVNWKKECLGLPVRTLSSLLARALLLADAEESGGAGQLVRYYRRSAPMPAMQGEEWANITGLLHVPLVFAGPATDWDLWLQSAAGARAAMHLQPWGELLGICAPGTEINGGLCTGTQGYLDIGLPVESDPQAWAKVKGLRGTLRRDGEWKVIEWAPDSRKKKLVGGYKFRATELGWQVELQPLEKFELREYMRETGAKPLWCHLSECSR